MEPTTIEEAVEETAEQIERNAQLQADILQNIPAVAWTVTPDGRMDFINRFYLEVTGQSLGACIAPLPSWNKAGSDLPPFLAALHPEHKERIRKIFWDGIRSGRGWTFEAPFFHCTDGKYHWHLDRAVPVRDRHGNLVRFVGTCADIDELKQAEAKNNALLEISNAITGAPPHRPLDTQSPPTYSCPAFSALCEALRKVVAFDWAELAMYQHKKDAFEVLAASGEQNLKHFEPERQVGCEQNSVGWVFDHRQTLLRSDLGREQQYDDERRLAAAGMRAYAVVPLLNQGHCTGVLRVAKGHAFRYSAADVEFLSEVARQLSLAVENLKAYEEIAALKARLEIENTYLQDEIRKEHNFDEILGNSSELLKLLDRVESTAPTDANVLIMGETGSGKELIARAIHNRSARKDSPLVKVNCGAIPAGLVESELFGHVKGAFTSASERRVGRFELANGGTLFLDEVGELPLETQVKLLRVLQEQEFEPVGSSRTVKVNVRIIAATNRDLSKAVQSGGFRSDLYYRLNVIPLHVPALRNRRADIPELAMSFLRQSAKRIGKPMQSVSHETMSLLVDYSWPGNIRELQNVIERGIVLSKGPVLKLGADLLPIEEAGRGAEPGAALEPGCADSLEEVQRRHILQVLKKTGWVVSGPNGAGTILGIHPNTLHSLMNRLGIRRAAHAAGNGAS